MPGAGKSTAVGALQECSYPVVVMGDFVREAAKKRGLAPTPENLGKFMLDLRRKYGKATVAKITVRAMKRLRQPILIIDGVRSLEEVKEFKRSFPRFKLIAIHASAEERFKRLQSRERSDDVMDFQHFVARDKRELAVGVGHVIAMSNKIISANSLDELRSSTIATVEAFLHEN